jgi:hypothetical protein
VTKRYAMSYLAIILAATALVAPDQAHAYIGPGVGLGAILVTVAFVLGFILLLVGFVWYPIKRMIRSSKRADATRESDRAE